MVTKVRHIGFENTPHIMMQRSKTSMQLKKKDINHPEPMSPVQRTVKSGKQAHQYWKFNHNRQNTTRRSSLGTNETHATPRRRSIDCTYQIGVWRLADELRRDNKVFEVANGSKENNNGRNASQVLPPIRSKSQHNIHLISKSKTVIDAQDASSTTPSNSSFDKKYSGGRRHSMQNEDRSMTPDNYRNRSPIPIDKQGDEARSKYWKSKFNREINLSTALSDLSTGPKHSQFINSTKTKASSLHSRSSEGSSANTKVMMAKMSSRRRLSLPVSAIMPVMADHELGKSPEFHKAYKQLSRNSEEDTVHGLSASTLSNSKSLSADIVSTYGNMPPKESLSFSAFQSSTAMRRDSLQRIEEIPTEQIQSIPTTLVEEPNQHNSIYGTEQTDEDVPKSEHDELTTVVENSIPTQGRNSNNIDATQKSPHKHSTSFLDFEHRKNQQRNSNQDPSTGLFIANQGNSRTNSAIDRRKENDNVPSKSDKKVDTRVVACDSKTETTINSDDQSLIDASILDEPDEDLCDADFREKRIISWLINVETGDRVDEVIETTIPPSPPCGSMETAIKIVYAGN